MRVVNENLYLQKGFMIVMYVTILEFTSLLKYFYPAIISQFVALMLLAVKKFVSPLQHNYIHGIMFIHNHQLP